MTHNSNVSSYLEPFILAPELVPPVFTAIRQDLFYLNPGLIPKLYLNNKSKVTQYSVIIG